MNGDQVQPIPGEDFSVAPNPEADRMRGRFVTLLLTGLSLVMLLGGVRMLLIAHGSVAALSGGAVLVVLGAPLPIIGARRAWTGLRELSRLRRDRCVHCGYPHAGLASARCPECGRDPVV